MTMAVSRARGANFEYRRSWMRVGLIVACLGALAACGDDEGPTVLPGVDPGPNPAGSCNFASQGTCDEYSEVDAIAGTADSCANSGGTWTSGKCPEKARNGVCIDISPASRTYTYTEAAAESLKSACPMAKFIVIKPGTGRGMMYAAGKGGASGAAAGKGGSAAAAGAGGGSAGGGAGAAGGGAAGAAGGGAGASGAGAGNGGGGGAGGTTGD